MNQKEIVCYIWNVNSCTDFKCANNFIISKLMFARAWPIEVTPPSSYDCMQLHVLFLGHFYYCQIDRSSLLRYYNTYMNSTLVT